MAETWKEFDLIIEHTNPQDFGNWLISESKDLFDRPIRSRSDEKDLFFVHSPRLIMPGDETIHPLFVLNAIFKETAEFEPDDVREIETDIEGFIQIEIRKLQSENIQVIGYWEDITAYKPIRQIKERIIETYNPKVLFDFEKISNSFYRPDINYFSETIFDFIIETTPVNFGNWVDSEIARLYPGVFTIVNTPESSKFISTGGGLIPPDKDYPYYCYAMGGRLLEFEEMSPGQTDLGPIMGIEIRDLKEGRIQAICKCQEFPPLVGFLHELRTEVIRVFDPMYSVAVDKRVLARLDEIAGDLGERLDDLKQGQITIYQRLDIDTQETLKAILNEVRDQRLTQGEMRNTLNSIRRVLKFIQENGIPIDDEQIENSLSEIHEAVNSDISMSQKLELSLPIIPLLLNYKFEIDMGVDLASLWRDIVNLIQDK